MGINFTPIKPMEKMSFTPDIQSAVAGTSNFAGILGDVLKEYETLSNISAQDSENLAFGNANQLAQIQINSMKADAVLQTAVQVTSRAVNAYKEIMQMQV